MMYQPYPYASVRQYFVPDAGGGRAFPYPGIEREGLLPNMTTEQRDAEVRLWLGRFRSVHARVQQRVLAGGQPSRDEMDQLIRYSMLVQALTRTDIDTLAVQLA